MSKQPDYGDFHSFMAANYLKKIHFSSSDLLDQSQLIAPELN